MTQSTSARGRRRLSWYTSVSFLLVNRPVTWNRKLEGAPAVRSGRVGPCRQGWQRQGEQEGHTQGPGQAKALSCPYSNPLIPQSQPLLKVTKYARHPGNALSWNQSVPSSRESLSTHSLGWCLLSTYWSRDAAVNRRGEDVPSGSFYLRGDKHRDSE